MSKMQRVKEIFTHKWAMEFYRFSPFIGVVGLILLPDASLHVILFGLAIILFATLVGHVVRKILFPYFDLAKLVDGIEDHPVASAMVICATIYLVTCIIQAFVMLLR